MADNLTINGVTVATKDLNPTGPAIHLQKNNVADEAGNDAIGVVGTTPAPNTILGRLKAIFDKLASSIAVTGTFWQAVQPVSGTFWQTTQPISAASLPLATGAATSAKQDTAIAGIATIAGADNWAAVTPSDTADLATVPKALYIGAAGNIVLTGADGQNATFAVLAGQTVPFRARRVRATNTTATGIIALS